MADDLLLAFPPSIGREIERQALARRAADEAASRQAVEAALAQVRWRLTYDPTMNAWLRAAVSVGCYSQGITRDNEQARAAVETAVMVALALADPTIHVGLPGVPE